MNITTSTVKRFIALCCAVVLLAACRVDVQVSMLVNPNGSGTVTVTIDVDKEIVQRSPDVADNLDFSDLKKNGWTLTEPVDTASGGKQVVLARDFANVSISDDQYEIARKNTNAASRRLLLQTIPGDGGEATRMQMNKIANRAVYQGQAPPINILNPVAWADFIQAWKRGDFKRKN